MKKGDWVIHVDGRVGVITITNFNAGYHLVDFEGEPFASCTNHNYLKPVEPAVADILNAVKS